MHSLLQKDNTGVWKDLIKEKVAIENVQDKKQNNEENNKSERRNDHDNVPSEYDDEWSKSEGDESLELLNVFGTGAKKVVDNAQNLRRNSHGEVVWGDEFEELSESQLAELSEEQQEEYKKKKEEITKLQLGLEKQIEKSETESDISSTDSQGIRRTQNQIRYLVWRKTTRQCCRKIALVVGACCLVTYSITKTVFVPLVRLIKSAVWGAVEETLAVAVIAISNEPDNPDSHGPFCFCGCRDLNNRRY